MARRIEDVVVPILGVRTGVEQLMRVDAGRRRARHVADVVGSGAARDDADIGEAFEEMRAPARAGSRGPGGCSGSSRGHSRRRRGRRGRRWRRTASASGCRCGCAAGTYSCPARGRRRTARGSASGNCRRASGARPSAPRPSAGRRTRTDARSRFHFSWSASFLPAATCRSCAFSCSASGPVGSLGTPAGARPIDFIAPSPEAKPSSQFFWSGLKSMPIVSNPILPADEIRPPTAGLEAISEAGPVPTHVSAQCRRTLRASGLIVWSEGRSPPRCGTPRIKSRNMRARVVAAQ